MGVVRAPARLLPRVVPAGDGARAAPAEVRRGVRSHRRRVRDAVRVQCRERQRRGPAQLGGWGWDGHRSCRGEVCDGPAAVDEGMDRLICDSAGAAFPGPRDSSLVVGAWQFV